MFKRPRRAARLRLWGKSHLPRPTRLESPPGLNHGKKRDLEPIGSDDAISGGKALSDRVRSARLEEVEPKHLVPRSRVWLGPHGLFSLRWKC